MKIEDDSTTLRPLGVLCRVPSRDGWCRLVLDLFLTHGLLHPAMICVWWSLWNLEGNYLLTPCEMSEKDSVVWDSVVIGYLGVLVTAPLADMVGNMGEAPGGGCGVGGRRIAVNCLSWVGLVGSLNVWRGVWSVADFHFLPVGGHIDNLHD